MSLLKMRTISVQGITCAECEKQLEDAVAQLEGVQEVQADAESRSVAVSYDLLKTKRSAIEERIRGAGFASSVGFWQRLKRACVNYMEENELENFTAEPAPCCSDADAIRARSQRINRK